jgi:hypothetical protein
MAHATRPLRGQTDVPCSTLVGRVLAQIDGALGSSVLVGLDRLAICRCDGPNGMQLAPRPPLLLADLVDATIVHVGSLPVLSVTLVGREDRLPVLILERHQIGAALDGLVVLRRLISASRAGTAGPTSPVLILPTPPRHLRVAR